MQADARQAGFVSRMALLLIVFILLFVGAGAFGAWAFMGRQDFKNNVDKKIADAVATNAEQVKAQDAVAFAEEAKKPLKSFVGPAAFGRVTVNYPKTWSAYIIQHDEQSSDPLDAYFHPDFVPDSSGKDNSFALRVQIVNDAYSDVANSFKTAAEKGGVSISAYTLPAVPGVVGTRVDGEVLKGKRGSMVIFPLRNVTLQVWTESESFLPDFNNSILANLSFAP